MSAKHSFLFKLAYKKLCFVQPGFQSVTYVTTKGILDRLSSLIFFIRPAKNRFRLGVRRQMASQVSRIHT